MCNLHTICQRKILNDILRLQQSWHISMVSRVHCDDGIVFSLSIVLTSTSLELGHSTSLFHP